MKQLTLCASLFGLAFTLAACGADRTVVVQPQPESTDHVVIEHE